MDVNISQCSTYKVLTKLNQMFFIFIHPEYTDTDEFSLFLCEHVEYNFWFMLNMPTGQIRRNTVHLSQTASLF